MKERVVFALRCLLGQACSVAAVEMEFDSKKSWGLLTEDKTFSASPLEIISIEALRDIKEITNYTPPETLEQKINTLKALFNSAMRQVRTRDVSCVLFFSILEAIYVQDNQELTYKLTMRLTKKLGRDSAFANKLLIYMAGVAQSFMVPRRVKFLL